MAPLIPISSNLILFCLPWEEGYGMGRHVDSHAETRQREYGRNIPGTSRKDSLVFRDYYQVNQLYIHELWPNICRTGSLVLFPCFCRNTDGVGYRRSESARRPNSQPGEYFHDNPGTFRTVIPTSLRCVIIVFTLIQVHPD